MEESFEEVQKPTNDEIIIDAVNGIIDRQSQLEVDSVTRDYAKGFIAGLEFMKSDYDEYDSGHAWEFLRDQFLEYDATRREVNATAKFKQMATTDGATKLVFELSSRSLHVLPSLISLTGKFLHLDISDPQLALEILEADEVETEELPLDINGNSYDPEKDNE